MLKHNKFINILKTKTLKLQDCLKTKITFQYYEIMRNIIWAHKK
jgi:hypothetical protein